MNYCQRKSVEHLMIRNNVVCAIQICNSDRLYTDTDMNLDFVSMALFTVGIKIHFGRSIHKWAMLK